MNDKSIPEDYYLIYVWPGFDWCSDDDLEEYIRMFGDDYIELKIDPSKNLEKEIEVQAKKRGL